MNVIAVIPARYDSQRFPGKPLADLCGKPLIYWAWKQTCQCERIDRVSVATDDERIAKVVRGFGGDAVMTSPECASGSDRIAEVIRDVDCDLVVNVQGDEPDINPQTLTEAIDALVQYPECDVSTAKVAIRKREDFESPHIVKVACDSTGRALYFSRSPIPNRIRSEAGENDVWGYKHLGIYVYRKPALLEYTSWQPTELEQLEKLEQLRFLENGRQIVVVETQQDSIGVDTQEELDQVRELLEARL